MLQPYPQEAEIYVAWESSTLSPAPYSLYVFLPCAFLFCPAAVGSADDKCIGIDICILMDVFLLSLLHYNTSGTVLQLRLVTGIEV